MVFMVNAGTAGIVNWFGTPSQPIASRWVAKFARHAVGNA
jgi:hypothetical protein